MRFLPEKNRQLFRQPFGRLYPSFDHLLPLLTGRVLYSVGDVVTANLLMAGRPPDVAIIDGHTMRRPYPGVKIPEYKQIFVQNPAGGLTEDLISATKRAAMDHETVIQVEGEEDLAVVPLALHASDGTVILYGQPGEGVVLLEITTVTRNRAKDLLSCFEVSGDTPDARVI